MGRKYIQTIVIIGTMFIAGTVSIFAQKTFELKDASKYFDIKVTVAKCDDALCNGEAKFEFHKKGSSKPYQTIEMADTYLEFGEKGVPKVNTTVLYDEQSVVNVDDYNFDGMEDVAISDGTNGSYNMPSYEIYLSSRSAGKFVYSKEFSELAHHLGMLTVNKRRKFLETFDKSGCCWHITERYRVVNNRPVKFYEMVEDATIEDESKVKVTTKTLVGSKWRTSVKYVKREE